MNTHEFKYSPGDTLLLSHSGEKEDEALEIEAIVIDKKGSKYDFFFFSQDTAMIDNSPSWRLKA